MEEQKEEQKQKSFWKRYEVIIIAAITILFIYLLVVFNQKVSYLLGNELIVQLNPSQKSFEMHYNDIARAEFDISIDNVAYCKASCSYTFTDRSRNEAIEDGQFKISKGMHFTKAYDLSVKRLGSGQDLYSFDVKCHSIRSITCLTKGEEKLRSSLVTVNYDLTETEKQLKEILRQNVTKLLNVLNDVDVTHQQINQKFFELSYRINLKNLSRAKIDIDDMYDKTRVSIENLRSIWAVEDYLKLNQLFNESYFTTLSSIKNSINKLDNDINKIAELHNLLLSRLSNSSKNFNELKKIASLLGDDEISGISANIEKFSKLAASFTNNTFESYNDIINSIDDTTKEQSSAIEKTRIPAASLLFDFEHELNFENDFFCSLKGDCIGEMSINSSIEGAEEYFKRHPAAGKFTKSCNSLKNLESQYSEIINQTLETISSNGIVFPNDNEFLTAVSSSDSNMIRAINNSYYNTLQMVKSENKTDEKIINIAENKLPKGAVSLAPVNYNQSTNISMYLLSRIKLSDNALKLLGKCSNLSKIEDINNFDFNPINANTTYNITSKIKTELSDNPPICCIFNDCNPCCNDDSCRNDPKTFPVIFLHGHSFSKANSPEFSLDAFNKLQSKLQDDGYLNVGIISLYSKNEPLQSGIWGLSGKPVSVKVSYYYDAFRQGKEYIVVPTKSENIDTYALRLKDLIEIVKERTNKPKVNIISHSMGGLVARRYIQIFGEEDIDKLIMIATPNKGITGSAINYCTLLGENRECQDMSESSLFLNKLNDPSKQPSKVKLYSIIGQGCKMDEGDGDGVSLVENAKLNNAESFFVNGTCIGFIGEKLHTEMLNIDKYPETYSIITEILKQ